MADADVKIKIGVEGDAETKNKLKSIGTSMQNMSATFKKAGTVMLGVGTALAGSMFAVTKKWAEAGDEVAKMAKRTGWAVESLSELRHVAEISGTELDAFEKGTRKLSMAIVDAAEGGATYEEALNRIGLSGQNLMGIPIEEQFWTVANALAAVEDDTIKAATAMELFGRTGTQLFPMLEEGQDGIAKLRQEAHDLGVVFTDETAKDAEEFQDAMTNLKTSMAGVGAELAKVLGPELTKFIDKATLAVTAVKEWAAANPNLVTMLKVLVGVLIGGGGLLLALSQIARMVMMINSALAIFHALSGPAGWIKLAAGLAIAGGAIYGISKLMGGGGTMVTPVGEGEPAKPPTKVPGMFGFASGGIVTRPTVGLLGEAGPEAVVPLSKGMGNVTVIVEGSLIAEQDLIGKLRAAFIDIKERNTTTGF
uniref:Putative tail tape measure protein n=1 Tax=viral metagenome TaxID=1070528 RepID=A0A6H1ZQ73_9ZZZZ